MEPIPRSLGVSASATNLIGAAASSQLTVTATYSDNSTKDVSSAANGTSYTISSTNIATVSPDGLVTAKASGTVIISAINDGAIGIISLRIVVSGDTDGDGIPDDLEIRNGLNPNNPVDAEEDPDGDGLTNYQELMQYGTNPHLADTDGDGISDGDEVRGRFGFVTNPLLADSDGDGVRDLLEIQSGSNPTNSTSLNLGQALQSLEVTPLSFVLTVNTVLGEASRQLAVTGHLKDGTTIDLTSNARGTVYTSSDLFIANFGADDGRVFGGNNGQATITVTNSGFSKKVSVIVRTFAPTALSSLAIPGFANNVKVNGNYAYVAAGASGLQVVDVTDRRNPHIVGSRDTPGNANDVRVVGNLAYVADGAAGLQIIDISDPAAPFLRGTVDTPGEAWDVMVAGTRAFVADGASGLQIIDVSNPSAPVIVKSVNTPGTAKGVDVAGNLAVVADGASGLQIIDISNVPTASIISTVSTGGDARDVAINGNFAYVADFVQSMTAVDLTDPAHPVLGPSTPRDTGGYLQDIAIRGRFAFGADVFFVNGVPIVDVSTPSTLLPRAILDFSAYHDDNGTGIAVDEQYVYLTAGPDTENGASGNTRLYIGQYQAIADTAGLPPIVSVISPLDGSAVVAGTPFTVEVSASDDIGVAGVTVFMNGVAVGTDTAEPFQVTVTPPVGATNMTISASAIDYGSNVGQSPNVVLTVAPSPPPTVHITSPAADVVLMEGETITISADAADDTSVRSVVFTINGVPRSPDITPPYTIGFVVPTGRSNLTVIATATDNNGQSTSDTRTVNVIPDPLTTVTGRIVSQTGQPVAGAAVSVFGTYTNVSGPDGRFTIPGVPTVRGGIVVLASTVVANVTLSAGVGPLQPVRGGITDAGDIQVTAGSVPISVVRYSDVWKYDRSGVDLGTAWRERVFDDHLWPSGPAPLGYPANEVLPASVGPVATLFPTNAAITTYYFRRYFINSNNPAQVSLIISNVTDDGCIIYLNGRELTRYGMPTGAVTFSTFAAPRADASTDIGTNRIDTQVLSGTNLVIGTNVLAIEVHQITATSSDIIMATAVQSALGFGPVISHPSEPADRTVLQGRPTTLSSDAVGFPIPTYQWFFNGASIPNATNATYRIAAMRDSDVGVYFCSVRGFGGVVDSRPAQVEYEADVQGPRLIGGLVQLDGHIELSFDETLQGIPADLSLISVYPRGSDPVASNLLVTAALVDNDTNLVVRLQTVPTIGIEYQTLIRTGAVRDVYGNPSGPEITAVLASEMVLADINATFQWRYDQSGVDRGTIWRTPAYDDGSWPSGPALLGFDTTPGNIPEPIRTPMIPPNQGGPLTTYFRAHINLPVPPSRVRSLQIRHLVDDGAVVYFNGQEVYRIAVPANQVFSTLSSRTVGNAAYEGPFSLSATNLVAGDNLVAVEVHQSAPTTSDVIWGAKLTAVIEPLPAAPSAPDAIPQATLNGGSIARVWDEQILSAIRIDTPHPPVHARNLFHLSTAMYDVWAAYDTSASGYVYRKKHKAVDIATARREAISYAAYHLLKERYAYSKSAAKTLAALDVQMAALGYDKNNISLDTSTAAGVGNSVYAAVSAACMNDGAGQASAYVDVPALQGGYVPINPPCVSGQPGTTVVDINRWQPLAVTDAVDQNGFPASPIQKFLGSQWLQVRPFALTRGSSSEPWINPGPQPRLGGVGDARFREEVVDIIRRSGEMTADDGVLMDISPGAYGNNSLGANDGTGRPINPVTGLPYAPNWVKRGDFARVLAEFWADGPNSETPPGHWNVIANSVADNTNFVKRIGGTGPILDPLEWDVKVYFALNAALHDAACAAWSLKRYYDGGRPISYIRYMGQLGQSGEPGSPSYHPMGLPLVSNVVELVTTTSAASGGRHSGLPVGRVVIYCWPGQPAKPLSQHSGVRWTLPENWLPYQKANFITPSFPGYISGHSAFSRSAAEILTRITGSAYFPNGLGTFNVPANTFLSFEQGPSEAVQLQWATYYDAADQAGESRRWGGIHVAADDFTGRIVGSQSGQTVWATTQTYFDGSVARSPISLAIRYLTGNSLEFRFNTTRGFYYSLQSTFDLGRPFTNEPPGFIQTFDSSMAFTNDFTSPSKFYRVLGMPLPVEPSR